MKRWTGRYKSISNITLILVSFLSILSASPVIQAQNGCIYCELAGLVDGQRIESLIRDISGEDSVIVEGSKVLIDSRFTFSEKKLLALEYLRGEVASLGYETLIQDFVLTVQRPIILSLLVSDTDDTVWVGSAEGRVYRSVIDGVWRSFELISTVDGCQVFSLYQGPSGGIWAGCGIQNSPRGALYYSEDGGTNWENRTEEASTLNKILSVSFVNESFGIAVGQLGTMLITPNGGETWALREDATQVFGWRDLNDSDVSGSVYWVVGERAGLYNSGDLGITWTETILGNVDLTSISFADSLHGIIGADGGIYYTRDGGGSWNYVSLGSYITGVEMEDTLIASACGGEGGVFISVNGGMSWEELGGECASNLKMEEVAFAGPETVFTAGSEEVRQAELEGGSPVECYSETLGDTLIGKNLIFRLEGKADPGRKVVICAHYDSYNWRDPYGSAPGADDNGTGVAGVMECARALVDANTDLTIEFLLFDGEEKGKLGSRYFVDNIDTTDLYEAVFNFDMYGRDYSGDGWAVEIAGRDAGPDTALYRRLCEAASFLDLDLKLEFQPDSPASDHQSFWEIEGVPAVLVIEGDFRSNPHYHSSTDRVEYLNLDYVAQNVRMVLVAAAMEAGYRGAMPEALAFLGSYPNPFTSNTRIRFELPRGMELKLGVYDVTGKKVADLINGYSGPGRVEYVWDGRNSKGNRIASGVYFLRFQAAGMESTGKVIYIR